MNRWTLLLCEGDHDRAALCQPLIRRGWLPLPKRALAAALPTGLGNLGQNPATTALVREEHGAGVVIHACLGVGNLFAGTTTDLLGELRVDMLAGLGVIVDADETGVAARNRQFEAAILPLVPGPLTPWSGDRMDRKLRVGLWVAPDQESPGSLDDLLVEALTHSRPGLLGAARAFVLDTPDFQPPDFRAADRPKAILGAAAQSLKPGRSLSVALGDAAVAPLWLNAAACQHPTLAALTDWIEKLALP